MPHQIRHAGRDLYAWCAWDPLFLARVIGDLQVATADPVTGEAIAYCIGADGVLTGASHPDAVLSFLRPGQPWDGAVIATFCHPISGTPTRQRVELDGFPGVYAMCAIDALGIPAMAGKDGQITATDPYDDAPVQVSVRSRMWTWIPPGAVVVYGRTADCGTDCGSWEVMCPHTTFHASRDSARAYLAARPGIDGEILGQRAAIDLGRRIFGPLLRAGGT